MKTTRNNIFKYFFRKRWFGAATFKSPIDSYASQASSNRKMIFFFLADQIFATRGKSAK